MLSDFSTEKKWVRLRTYSPLLIWFFFRNFSTFSFSLYLVICPLALCCVITNQGSSPVKQGCCPSLTGFLNSSGHLQKWYMYPAFQTHYELSSPLFTRSFRAIKLGSHNNFLAVLLYDALNNVRHLQIPAHISTYAYLLLFTFLLLSCLSKPDFFLWITAEEISWDFGSNISAPVIWSCLVRIPISVDVVDPSLLYLFSRLPPQEHGYLSVVCPGFDEF